MHGSEKQPRQNNARTLPAFVLFPFLALFAALPAKAASPAAYCGNYAVTNCTLTVSANQEILIIAEGLASNTTTISDTKFLTYTNSLGVNTCDKNTPGTGTNLDNHVYLPLVGQDWEQQRE
jgi:hypothetical protein